MDVRFGIQDQTFPPKTMNDALRSLAAPQDSTISMAASEGKADVRNAEIHKNEGPLSAVISDDQRNALS